MSGFAELAAGAAQRGLRFLVSGGQAVNALGYQRVTLDLDLIIPRDERQSWLDYLFAAGYALFADGGTFLQTTSPPGALRAWPLDLMLVDRQTFESMWEESRTASIEGVRSRIVSPMHLIALKLHALRGGAPERHPKDYQDVVGILRTHSIDPRSAPVVELFRRYGTMDWHARILESFPPSGGPTGG